MRPRNLIVLLTAIVGLLSFVMATSKGAIVWDVSVNDPGSTYQAYYEPIDSHLSAALNEYSNLLMSNMPSSIQIEISFSSGLTRSTGYGATSVFVDSGSGTIISAQGVASVIATGMDPNGPAPDLYLKFQLPKNVGAELLRRIRLNTANADSTRNT